MKTIRVWTKQHKIVWEILRRDGVYHALRRPIKAKAETDFIGPIYDWLAQNSPSADQKPTGADYPIWLSFSREGTMLPTPDTVLIELEIDPAMITSTVPLPSPLACWVRHWAMRAISTKQSRLWLGRTRFSPILPKARFTIA